MTSPAPPSNKDASRRRVLGRYVMYGSIASGGMASVHLGRLQGQVGFARTVAIKRLHPHLAKDPAFVAMFLDEARVAARIRHPNVVSTLDVAAIEGEVLLVMDYIEGESLARVIRLASKHEGVPPDVASGILVGVLEGLHAAHEAKNERGEPLEIVHRDVSPQNVIVGTDGVARVLDFGVAKAEGRLQETADGNVKGKFAYMSPEQVAQGQVDRRTDVFAASILLWETLVGRKLFAGDVPAAVIQALITQPFKPPSAEVPNLPKEIDAVLERGLSRDVDARFASAHEMALALEKALPPATPRRIATWLKEIAGGELAERARHVAAVESDASDVSPPPDLSSITGSGSVPSVGPTRRPPPAEANEPTSRTSGGTAVPLVTPAPPPASRHRAAVIAAAAAALVAVTVGVTLLMTSRSGPQGAASSSAAQAELEPSATATPTPAATEAPSATAPSALASVPASASTPPVASVAAKALAPTSPASRPPTPTAKPRGDCANPFTIDASGKKRPRPECF